MFATCCCAPEEDEVEALDKPLGTDERSMPAVEALRTETPDESSKDLEEKVRLNALVSNFAKQALKGVKCVLLQEGGACTETEFRISKRLDCLHVMAPQEARKVLVKCRLATIQDVYTWLEDGQAAFQGEFAKLADSAGLNKEQLLMIVHCPNGTAPSRFCLLLEDSESRNAFLESLRVLCMYAMNHQNEDAVGGTTSLQQSPVKVSS